MPSVSILNSPQFHILSHPLSETDSIRPPTEVRPEIIVSLFNQQHTALLDSGASVSAISESLYKTIKNDPSKFKIPIYPLTGVFLSTALTGKTSKISIQIFVTIHMNDQSLNAVLLVVPQLTVPLILGNDWLGEHNVLLDYHTRSVSFPSLNFKIPFVSSKHPHSNTARTTPLNNIQINDSLNCIDIPVSHTDSSEINSPTNNKTSFDIPLEPTQRDQFNCLITQYQHIFQDRPGLHKHYSYKFNVIDDKPFKLKPYPVPFFRRPAFLHELKRMIEWGVVERSDSPYNNPILSVQKPDGSMRLCLDARRLNSIISPTRDYSPPIEEILAKFNNKLYFSTLDFASGYWQIPLDPSVRKYTSFLYDGRSYQFCVVPFGLNISNAAFGKRLEQWRTQRGG